MPTSVSSIKVKAPPEAVWTALTEPEFVERWQYGSVLVTDWSVGGPIRFTTIWEGQTLEQWGTVLAFQPPTMVRYSLFAPRPDIADVPENYFTMTYELVRDGDVTEVVITHDDPRAGDDAHGDLERGDGESDSPVLVALRDVAESIRRD